MNRIYILSFVVAIFISCSSEEEPMAPVVDDSFEFVGDWLGSWSDSLFPAISVSAKVSQLSDNIYSGALYIDNEGKGPYTPCCGATNDNGNFRFSLVDGQVTGFNYVQVAPEYMGGCPGEYSGDGVISTDGKRMIISFTGTDCDGFHDNGTITWTSDK